MKPALRTLLCLALTIVPAIPAAQTPTYDLLIRGGRIVDGTGNAWFRGDVALRGDTIAAVGSLSGAMARRVIEANGQIIAPGFILRPGMKADVVVFDPERVRDKATFADPHQYAEGFSFVIVNGSVVLDDGKMTEARPGQVLFGATVRR